MEYFRTKGELSEPGKCVMLQKELHTVHSSHNIIRIRPEVHPLSSTYVL